ncbi:hypothetical protein KI811_01130 [Geobacter hydrogenophilus]|uniref:Uncharacterized protein n=1 Tax=Geobacter hydrogenophilus TaxID=40983 RepID=A0A9W6G3N4_9BACT|nr:hypothetical protein [Geobacter hydrogenophilus]MBT0892421.1 hypothetical protein [Geobacter hydrogenophilus]GLI39817.1 hypothetical protein GHYDROH2_33180 [Geobacter hydrogenophilus]
MKKLIIATAGWVLLSGATVGGYAAEKGAGNELRHEKPVHTSDHRPHIPRMLELVGPILDRLVDILRKDQSAETVAMVSETLKEASDEIKEMYRLSMATSDVRQQVEDLYRRVKETERIAGELGKKQR